MCDHAPQPSPRSPTWPPELRGTGAIQAIDRVKLYGGAVRWFCEAGLAEPGEDSNAYWRSLACRAWAVASGAAGGLPGPVHVNVPLREPLVPESADVSAMLAGRPGGAPWTSYGGGHVALGMASGESRSAALTTTNGVIPAAAQAGPASGGVVAALELPWTERGVIVCGDGDYDVAPLLELAALAGWPVLAEPSSGARTGPHALSAYPYLLASPAFMAAHQPDVIVAAGRPGLSRALLGDLAFLHDLPGLVTGPGEPMPDLTLIVVNNNGGGIFSLLEQAMLDGPFERLFGTPHGAALERFATGAGLGCQRLERAADLPGMLRGSGLRVIEARTDRAAGAALRARLGEVCADALSLGTPT